MTDPITGTLLPPPRTRKRILDPSDAHEDDNNARRPSLFNNEWQETFKGVGVPHKKGYTGMDSHLKRQAEDINQGLADNFEDSLSGLGIDISSVTYDMKEALSALPHLSLFKQESSNVLDKQVVSPIPSLDDSLEGNSNGFFKLINGESLGQSSSALEQIFRSPLSPTSSCANYSNTSPTLSNVITSSDPILTPPLCNSTADLVTLSHDIDNQQESYQYILGAPTSIATKVNEESLTYLNQGQSYEIKVKKLGDLTRCQGSLYRTLLRICFHERKMQNMEKEQLLFWQQMRPGERILEIDVPLSYGVTEVIEDQSKLNICEFDWDPTKEVGVYVKVNCISTEFTPKKHGGEKGVPFRIQIETYNNDGPRQDLLHVCACQIKVFRLKGADRKHKQDREKISKRSPVEQEKYQKSCDCTILTELSPECAYIPYCEVLTTAAPLQKTPPPQPPASAQASSPPPPPPLLNYSSHSAKTDSSSKSASTSQSSSQEEDEGESSNCDSPYYGKLLVTNATPCQTQTWLSVNRFSKYLSMFANFAGADLLRLSRSELIEICGLADGIRLFNSLHSRNSFARLTLYVSVDPNKLYNAIYLENVTCTEFVTKVSSLINVSPDSICDVYLQGPSGIHILVNDEVIHNLKNESTLSIELLEDSARKRYSLLVRLISPIKKEKCSPT